ncbi:LptF/LptG family permease [Fibrivirga algicola]|uniref:YjgP/YjgQ family permease n=1 Tax=Fibrivirga algicola TaxID=2950420 RepID=A0ABX0QK44_9BACT|nr:LptF/LptG family permease [Fibrivirga algicola]NID11218.1 YjgP/YjgQ family permease [Fibrivirga algicola]
MKKIDKLVLKSFFGPFFLTLAVVIFIFLMRLLMLYIEEFVSKDITLVTFGRLLYFFAVLTVPTALPLAVLLSSLMTFGNLGEFFELTAMKSAGISLTRALRPLLVLAIFFMGFSFWFNNKVAPWANLKAYSLLYDIKTAKAALNLKEGIFYNDLPGYSIKVDKKLGDSLTNLVIYKNSSSGIESGNREIILAKSGRMYTDPSRSYLVFELHDGNDYQEYSDGRTAVTYTSSGVSKPTQFMRNGFKDYKLVISLESFGLHRTDEQQFEYHPYMKTLTELSKIADSLKRESGRASLSIASSSRNYYSYQFKTDAVVKAKAVTEGKWIDSLLAGRLRTSNPVEVEQLALSQAQNMLSYAQSNILYLAEKEKSSYAYELESHHKFTQAVSVFIMFLIGAPLGAIIRKGGFGLPVLVSILFFIVLYVLTLLGDKFAKDGAWPVPLGAWMANMVLFPVGLYLLRQARLDSRLFDKDAYLIAWNRLKARFSKSGQLQSTQA